MSFQTRFFLLANKSNQTGGKNMTRLAQKECVPCKGGIPPLSQDETQKLLGQLQAGWKIIDNHHLEKEVTFKDFLSALAYTNRVGELAETQGHHPDIYLSWGKVKITLWTHKINGLTESDFILAAKIDNL